MKEFVKPPKLPLKLLRFYCSPERLEEIEGDLEEVYNEYILSKGRRFSSLFFGWLVIKNFRSHALKRKRMKNKGLIGSLAMFLKHNVLITWRNVLKHKTTSVINIAGLAIGLSAFLVIFRIVQYELSFNEKIPDSDRIYRVYTEFSGSFSGLNSGTSTGIYDFVANKMTGVEVVAHFHNFGAKAQIPQVGKENKRFDRQTAILADSSYFLLTNQYEWLAGTTESSLQSPYQVVLTERQLDRYFGKMDPREVIGKMIIYNDSLETFVSGVVREPGYNSDFRFSEFISFATIESSWLKDRFPADEWSNTNSSSQIMLKASRGTSYEKLNDQLLELNKLAASKEEDSSWVKEYKLQPLSDLHYNSRLGGFDGYPTANLSTLTVLTIVAFALLLIAVFNFINLETAQASTKLKEVGVRKVMGSSRAHLVGRFLTESLLITFCAVALSVPLAYYGLEFFKEFVPNGMELGLNTSAFWISVLLLSLSVGVLAGIYPSLAISSKRPALALKSGSKYKGGKGGAILRKTLISFQFLFSQLLVVGTMVIFVQISYMMEKDMGFDGEGIIYLNTSTFGSNVKRDILVSEIGSMPEILEMNVQQAPPAQAGYSTSILKFKRGDEELMTNVHRKGGDTSYVAFYGLQLLAGRNVKASTEIHELLINETYLEKLGFSTPREALGIRLSMSDEDYEVVGILKDFHFRSLHNSIAPMMYLYQDDWNRCIAMKVQMGKGLQRTISKLTDKWEEVYPNEALQVHFLDETIESFYNAERRTSKLASTATGIAIFISCLGLFGLISFTIAQKSKEMGIRKVLGATVYQIGTMISGEFIRLIVLAFVISTPVSYFLIQKWMEDFAYQTTVSWWVYLMGGVISLLVAIISIGLKIIKASASNPVESLRYE